MPLQHKRLRWLTAHRPLPPAIGGNDRLPCFEAAEITFAAALEPMDGPVDRQIYGERAIRMLRLFTTEGALLSMGMGVCVDSTDGSCDYRIAQPVSHWHGHSEAVLERLG